MSEADDFQLDAISEEAFQPILELLQGGDPDAVARKAGITRETLFKMRDAFLANVKDQQTKERETPPVKVGRNEPCPCGSGKKYKRCCLNEDEAAKRAKVEIQHEDLGADAVEQDNLVANIEKTFGLYAAGKINEAIRSATKLLTKYPNEDRLHDIVATCCLQIGEFEKAIDICNRRMKVSEDEKAYFIEHGRYRDAEVDKPALSYYYPPMTWLQKQWIALKTRDYGRMLPETRNAEIEALVKTLKTADDPEQYPEKHAQGMELRKKDLEETIEKLKQTGPKTIPYLMPIACKYGWAGLFVPEIIAHYQTDLAILGLIDISMFGFAYASGASLHFLQEIGEPVVPHIQGAFSKNNAFDPIKTGLVSLLGNIRTDASYEFLFKLLDSDSHHIVNWAGDALAKFEKIEALPRLMAAAKRIGGEKMIDEAIRKLQELA